MYILKKRIIEYLLTRAELNQHHNDWKASFEDLYLITNLNRNVFDTEFIKFHLLKLWGADVILKRGLKIALQEF